VIRRRLHFLPSEAEQVLPSEAEQVPPKVRESLDGADPFDRGGDAKAGTICEGGTPCERETPTAPPRLPISHIIADSALNGAFRTRFPAFYSS